MFCSSRILRSMKLTTVTSPISSASRRRRRGCDDIRRFSPIPKPRKAVRSQCLARKIQVSLRTLMNVRVAAYDVKCFLLPPEAHQSGKGVGTEENLPVVEVGNQGRNPHARRCKKTQT